MASEHSENWVRGLVTIRNEFKDWLEVEAKYGEVDFKLITIYGRMTLMVERLADDYGVSLNED